MEYTLKQRDELIIEACQKETSKNPIEIFRHIVDNDFVRMHGPEHHVVDGACILTAYYNAGGHIELEEALLKLLEEGLRMPGATCGLWGVCGSCSSIGAALAIIDGTGPLTDDASYSEHLDYTSKALKALSNVGGPRCCKRNAYLALLTAIKHINEHYDVSLEAMPITCVHSLKNQQCIKEKCPFYNQKDAHFNIEESTSI